jgi:hypothetical protein
MKSVIYAATRHGYSVQAIDGGMVVYQYTAGNCQTESQAVLNPDSPGAVSRSQLRRWAKTTADQIANEWRIPLNRVEYDPDLEAQLEQCETTRKSLDHAIHTV